MAPVISDGFRFRVDQYWFFWHSYLENNNFVQTFSKLYKGLLYKIYKLYSRWSLRECSADQYWFIMGLKTISSIKTVWK